MKAVSRLWGRFNELTIPYYLRVPGFKLYSFIFGVKSVRRSWERLRPLTLTSLSEVSEPDLHSYRNLASFFYRTLKPDVRPLDPNPSAVLSPADGKVLQFGTIERGEVEQVKGMTYSLDALLGTSKDPVADARVQSPKKDKQKSVQVGQEDRIKEDEEFAAINGISYTLPNLFSGPQSQQDSAGIPLDASTSSKPSSVADVRADLALVRIIMLEP